MGEDNYCFARKNTILIGFRTFLPPRKWPRRGEGHPCKQWNHLIIQITFPEIEKPSSSTRQRRHCAAWLPVELRHHRRVRFDFLHQFSSSFSCKFRPSVWSVDVTLSLYGIGWRLISCTHARRDSFLGSATIVIVCRSLLSMSGGCACLQIYLDKVCLHVKVFVYRAVSAQRAGSIFICMLWQWSIVVTAENGANRQRRRSIYV